MATGKKIEPRTVKGFRDLPPHLAEAKFAIIDACRKRAQQAGFSLLMTPAIEFAEVLLGSGGQETDKEVYRFADAGGRELALRYDLTVSFARFVAEHQGQLVFPFKKFQVDEVWRGEKPQKGRYRQFCQADVDIVGVDSMAADVEVLLLIHANIQEFVGGKFTMLLNHRVLLNAVIKKFFPQADAEQSVKVLIAIDKLAKIGNDGVVKLIQETFPSTEAASTELLKVISSKDANHDTDMSVIAKTIADDPAATACLQRLQETLRILRDARPVAKGMGKFRLDLSVARGLGYYTGVVYETLLDELPGFGSVSSGGRYDTLVERFINRSLPGVGGSVGVDRLLAALEELQRLPKAVVGGLMVAVATEDAYAYAFQIVQKLREAGHVADIGMTSGKVGNQFKYADRRGYQQVITVGSDEMARQSFSLKVMATGQEQRDLPLTTLLDVVTKAKSNA